MVADALPTLDAIDEANRSRWVCDRDDCDGTPHGWWDWPHARTEQRAPDGDWNVWLICAGRGYGKTRAGAEWLADNALGNPNTRWAVVAATFGDMRDTCIEGESGLLAALRARIPDHDWSKAWNRSMGELNLPNGSKVKGFTADEPERLRGPQHHGAWCDETAAWRYPETWSQLQFGLRLGVHPRILVTTTPKPVRLVRDLVERASDPSDVRLTRGATFDNAANLSAPALAELRRRYEGTTLGRQELYAEILDEMPGALWNRAMFAEEGFYLPLGDDNTRTPPPLRRIVVAIDPAVTSGDDADETGIVVAGIGTDGRGYVLADLTCRKSPDTWARIAVGAYHEWSADRIIGETNNGGDLVETVIRTVDPNVPYRKVTASRGKRTRAEPIAALYEQKRVSHLQPFVDLEDQMVTWTDESDFSPDRVDALVWALSSLNIAAKDTGRAAGEAMQWNVEHLSRPNPNRID